MKKEKVGLVLEGGGVRGIYTAGVLDVFMEHGICLAGVLGVSAGAIHGCSYVSEQKGRSLRYYKKYCNDPRFISVRSWLKTGDMVGADFCYHELPDKLDIYDHDAFYKSESEFYVTCTNVETGKAEYIHMTDMKKQIEYLRASASLPYVSRIVEINGKKYLDGACADSIPVKAFQKMGYKRNVVVLTRPADYRKKQGKQGISKLIYRKYPKFVHTLNQRYLVYNRTMEQIIKMEKEGSIFVIRPKQPLEIGRFEKDPENVQKVYDIGYADAKAQIEELQKWLMF